MTIADKTFTAPWDIFPQAAVGQELGHAANLWDLFTREVTFNAASGANVITVPDNVANALNLVDAGGIEYMRVITTNAQPVVVWDEGGADVDFRWEAVGAPNALFIRGSDGFVGVGTATPLGHCSVFDSAVNTTVAYTGFHSYHRKTGGATDHSDNFIGAFITTILNQPAGEIGQMIGLSLATQLVAGSVGDVVNARFLWGISAVVDLDGGTVTNDVFGIHFKIDQEAANTVADNMYGCFMEIDADGTVGGNVYMVYLQEVSNVDFGIYQNGTAPSSMGGDFYWHGDGAGLLFGSMYAAAEIIVPIAAANPVEVENAAQDGWTAGELNGVTFPGGGTEHYLAITIPGRYEILWNMSFHIAMGAGSAIHGGVMIDGVAVRNNGEAHRDVANTNDTGNMGAPCIADLPNGNEEISLWILNDNSNDVHVDHATVTVKQEGGT